jgi:peptidase E
MEGTALLYSSHDRSNYIHNDLIVQRALRGTDNKRILFLPMSETPQNGSEFERQEFSYGTFRWFFSFYDSYGLEYRPFYWSSQLRKEDVDRLWSDLWSSEVVVLGGGNSETGLWRYKSLGAHFDGEPGKFGRILHERQQRGLLTAGYSAGADQLAETLFGVTRGPMGDADAFGLARNVMVSLHHEAARNEDLYRAATRFPHAMAFGLPNDAGIYVDQGILASGNVWQVIRFIVDRSWTEPSDWWHVKTRSGALIEHVYNDGRHWAFDDRDVMVRVQSQDNRFHEVWIGTQGVMRHYWTQRPSKYRAIEEILAAH